MYSYIILPLYSLYFCNVGKDGQDPCKQSSHKTFANSNYDFLVLNKSHTQATAKQISVVPLINPKNLQDVFASAYPSLNAIGRT